MDKNKYRLVVESETAYVLWFSAQVRKIEKGGGGVGEKSLYPLVNTPLRFVSISGRFFAFLLTRTLTSTHSLTYIHTLHWSTCTGG